MVLLVVSSVVDMVEKLVKRLEELLVVSLVVEQGILGKEEQIEVLMISGIIKVEMIKDMVVVGDLVMK